MSSLPWRTLAQANPDADYLVMASSLRLKRLRTTLRFFRCTRAVRRQLARAEGLVGYTLWAKPLAKHYWTLSVWTDEDALTAFMRAAPHAEIMERLHPDMGPTAFVRWSVKGSEACVTWNDALSRLAGAAEARRAA
jgi:heme-degrading monooxygenase HmoA